MMSIVVGWKEGLLLKDPKSERYLKLPEEKRKAILDRANASESRKYPDSIDAEMDNELWKLAEKRPIEIFGIWGEICVADLTAYALGKGCTVYIPKDYIISASFKDCSRLPSQVAMYRKTHQSASYKLLDFGEYFVFEPITDKRDQY